KQLSDLTLGILGMGRIGSQVARVGAALDMRVVYRDLVEVPAARRAGAAPVSFEELLRGADVLTIHVDSRPPNRGPISGAALAMCRADVVLINTSRGFVVDAGALARFLGERPQARAVLDVHEPEPFDASYPLLGVKNARLLPHIAAA